MSDEIPSTPPPSSQRQSNAIGDGGSIDVAASAVAASSNVQFPYRLHELLDEVDPSIITWLPDTQAFKVLDKQTFTEKTLPHYFNATKYKSFQRNRKWVQLQTSLSQCFGLFSMPSINSPVCLFPFSPFLADDPFNIRQRS